MRLIERSDTSLAIGLIAGTAVMFAQPFRYLLSIAEEVSRTYGIDLLPGFMVFVMVCSLHFWRKYRDAVAVAQVQAQAEEDAVRRSRELDQLVLASRGIANALDPAELRAQLQAHVPALLSGRRGWAAVIGPLGWEWILEPAHNADGLLKEAPKGLAALEAGESSFGAWRLWSLRHGDRTLGMLAVEGPETGEVSHAEDSQISALAAVLSVAIKNGQLFGELEIKSTTDALTGCCLRSHGVRLLGNELRRAQRTRSPLSVLMLDIDGFKNVNDTHGHVEGDRLLAAIGATLTGTLRTTDVKCRYGGDEFMVILLDTPEHAAHHVAENLRESIIGAEVSASTGPISCEVSVGVSMAELGELDALAVIRRADKALYDNKATGKGKAGLPVPDRTPLTLATANAAR